MPPVNILIKPASSACNIRCRYCFYRTLSEGRTECNKGMMSLDTLEKLVKNALSYADGSCCFAFQGGEPALVGLSFYHELIRLEKQYNTKAVEIQNTIQTNGTLITKEWAAFFAKHHFLIGLSLDGNRRCNQYRVDNDGQPIFDRLMETVRLFDQYQVEYNIVSVVTAASVKNVRLSYEFFKRKGFVYQQYIACLDEAPGKTAEYSLTPAAYGTFLKELFDLWYEDYTHGVQIDIRDFSNWIQMAAGFPPESCGMRGICECYFVVEGDGSVYPCDFYAADEWILGTVEDDFCKLVQSDRARQFIECSLPIHDKCRKCQYFALCRGGCRRWREPFVNGAPSLNCLCEAYRLFFDHCWDRILLLGQYLRENIRYKPIGMCSFPGL